MIDAQKIKRGIAPRIRLCHDLQKALEVHLCITENDFCVSAPPLLLLPPKLIYVVESHYGVIVTGQVTVNRRIVLYGIEDSGPIELLFT